VIAGAVSCIKIIVLISFYPLYNSIPISYGENET